MAQLHIKTFANIKEPIDLKILKQSLKPSHAENFLENESLIPEWCPLKNGHSI